MRVLFLFSLVIFVSVPALANKDKVTTESKWKEEDRKVQSWVESVFYIKLLHNIYSKKDHIQEIEKLADQLATLPEDETVRRLVQRRYHGNLGTVAFAFGGVFVGWFAAIVVAGYDLPGGGALIIGPSLGAWIGRIGHRQERRVLLNIKSLLVARLSNLVENAKKRGLQISDTVTNKIKDLQTQEDLKPLFAKGLNYEHERHRLSVFHPQVSTKAIVEAAGWVALCSAGLAKILGGL